MTPHVNYNLHLFLLDKPYIFRFFMTIASAGAFLLWGMMSRNKNRPQGL